MNSNPTDGQPVLQLRNIGKSFGPVEVLRDVSLDIRAGEVHAVLGENGAGKSTLIKIMTGTYQPSRGSLLLDGREITVHGPRGAIQHGISLVPQDVVAVPELSVGRNILLGSEHQVVARTRMSRAERRVAEEALTRIGADFGPDRIAGSLSVPEIRLMQIARALVRPGSVVVLDEPTAALSTADSELLLGRVEKLRELGKAIVYVTHRLGEVTRLADRVSVLRDGALVAQYRRGEFTREGIIRDMARVTTTAPVHVEELPIAGEPVIVDPAATPLLSVDALGDDGGFDDVSFGVRAGEIIGIAGVQGSGQSQLLAAVAGRASYLRGRVEVDGTAIPARRMRRSYLAGVALVPADRRRAGVVVSMSIRDNIAQPAGGGSGLRRLGFRRRGREVEAARQQVHALSTRCSSIAQLAGTLSGGNQQKVALSRALISSPRLILIDEPTQGIDVNAKAEVRALLKNLAATRTCGIVIATSEFEDLVGLADVVHVLRHGRQVATLGADVSYDQILTQALS